MSLVKVHTRSHRAAEPGHVRHSSETTGGKYQQDIKVLNETLTAVSGRHQWKEQLTSLGNSVTETDELHQRLLAYLSPSSPLRVEMDLIHSIPQSEIALTLCSPPDTSFTLPALSVSSSPYSKQIPSSLYTSYKNITSFDHLTYRQELTLMISKAAGLVFPKDPSRTQKLEKELLQAYEKGLQCDTRLCNTIWGECLTALLSIANVRKVSGSPSPAMDTDLVTVQQGLESLLEDFLSGGVKSESEILDSVSKLSQHFRILIKKMQSDHTVLVCELFWKTAIVMYDQLISVCKRQISDSFADVEQQAKREEHRITSHLRLLTEQWQARMDEVTLESARLKEHQTRLKKEVEHCMEMVAERDEELQRIRDSGVYVELERVLAEFVADAGDDPGDPEMPKSLYGSKTVNGVKMNPTRFGAGKPQPVVIPSVKDVPPIVQTPPPAVDLPPAPAEVSDTESDTSVEVPPLSPSKPTPLLPVTVQFSSPAPQNVILYQLSRCPQTAHLFRPKDVYKLFESLMNAKFQLDQFEESIDQTSRPRSLSEFALDYMYQQHGKRSETLKHVASLVKSLEKMRTDEDKYADLLYGLLGLGDTGEYDAELTSFLVKARMAFEDVLLKGKSKAGKADKEVGGKLTFAETADLVYSLFVEKREVGEAVLARVDLPDVDKVEKAKLIFCGKLAKIGRDLKYFFVQADMQKTGSVNFQVFLKTCRTSLEMNLSMDAVQILWSSLTSGETLTYPQLTALDFKGFSARAYSKPLAISKLVLLNSLSSQYFAMRDRDISRLNSVFQQFDSNSDGVLTLSEFTELIDSLEAGCPPSTIVQIFREAIETEAGLANPDAMSPVAFCKVALRHHLGGFGKSVFQSKLKHLFVKQSESPQIVVKKKGKKKQ